MSYVWLFPGFLRFLFFWGFFESKDPSRIVVDADISSTYSRYIASIRTENFFALNKHIPLQSPYPQRVLVCSNPGLKRMFFTILSPRFVYNNSDVAIWPLVSRWPHNGNTNGFLDDLLCLYIFWNLQRIDYTLELCNPTQTRCVASVTFFGFFIDTGC